MSHLSHGVTASPRSAADIGGGVVESATTMVTAAPAWSAPPAVSSAGGKRAAAVADSAMAEADATAWSVVKEAVAGVLAGKEAEEVRESGGRGGGRDRMPQGDMMEESWDHSALGPAGVSHNWCGL